MVSIQRQSGVQAAAVDTQAHIQEMASLVQEAFQQSGVDTHLASMSTAEINSQIHSTIEEAIKQ